VADGESNLQEIVAELADLPSREWEQARGRFKLSDADWSEILRRLKYVGARGSVLKETAAPPLAAAVRRMEQDAELAVAEQELPKHAGRGSRYRVIEKIGEGGMGVVYKAEQRWPVRRLIAIKVIKLGMDTKELVARFEAERQALAMMNHPNVARVLDAGMTQQGRPFFAMDFVAGVPLTRYCDQEKLTIRQRLELFIPVCQAVQHAHQKGIIHRDLKPGNILVQLIDGKPIPKVIDFGVAKATNHALTQHTLQTQTGSVLGTPEYMSPEQASSGGLDVDTRTDVYSLGVILYELLTGTLPLDAEQLRNSGIENLGTVLRETEAPLPSVRWITLVQSPDDDTRSRAEQIAGARRCQPSELRREISGDLDWIVLKAIEKERARRYETANGVAMDIQRYLNDEPVEASPPSTQYRLRKFARKYRGPLRVAAVFALLMIGATVVSAWLAVRARHAENEALLAQQRTLIEHRQTLDALAEAQRQQKEAERQKAIAQAHFDDVRTLADKFMFDVHEKIAHLPGSTPARALLVTVALDYLSKLSTGVTGDAALSQDLSRAYFQVADVQRSLGDSVGSVKSRAQGLALARKLADDNPTDAASQAALAWADLKAGAGLPGDMKNAELDRYRQAQSIYQKLADVNPAAVGYQQSLAWSEDEVANYLKTHGDPAGALELVRKSEAIHQALLEKSPSDLGEQRQLASDRALVQELLARQGTKAADPLAAHRQHLAMVQKIADNNPSDTHAQSDLAAAYVALASQMPSQGDQTEANTSLGKAIAIYQQLADADPTNAEWQKSQADAYMQLGERRLWTSANGSLPHFQQAQTIRRKLLELHPTNMDARTDVYLSYERVGDANWYANRHDAAVEIWRQGYLIRRNLKDENSRTPDDQLLLATVWGDVAHHIMVRGDVALGLQYYDKRLAVLNKLLSADPTNEQAEGLLAAAYRAIGDDLAKHGDPARALQNYDTSLSIRRKMVDARPDGVLRQHGLLEALGKPGPVLEKMAGETARPLNERIDLLRQARQWYVRQQQQYDQMKQHNQLTADDTAQAATIAGNPGRCDAAIEQLATAPAPTTQSGNQPPH
jgi:serine/threonine protein kinase/tetratricopeptide (TPR) repeat protein